jgi:hypothetical protein
MAAVITDDREAQDRTRTEVHRQVAQNLNIDGSSLDFLQRDALHYHVYNLEAFVDLVVFTNLVSPEDEALILNAIQFIEPYFSGREQHVEWVNSAVPFDRVRRDAGDPAFAIAPWEPSNARRLLRLARTHFPEIRNWSASVVDEMYSPRLKQIAALQEPQPQRPPGPPAGIEPTENPPI